MRNEIAKWEIKTSVFSGRKSQAGNWWDGPNVTLVRAIALQRIPIPLYDDAAAEEGG